MKYISGVIMAMMIVISLCTDVFSETILWYLTLDGERITYSVDISAEVGTVEMRNFNMAIETIAKAGGYSNLDQFQRIVNRSATGSITNFQIVDVIVDEK